MKKIYTSPRILVENYIVTDILAGSNRIEFTDDNASHDADVLSKRNNFFYEEFEDEE